MSDPKERLQVKQRQMLKALRAEGAFTHESMSSHLASRNVSYEPSALSNLVAGRRRAPMGLLPDMLDHLEPEEVAAFLTWLGRNHNVVARVADTEPRGSTPAEDLVGALGRVTVEDLAPLAAVIDALHTVVHQPKRRSGFAASAVEASFPQHYRKG